MDIKEHFYSDDPTAGHPDVRTNPPGCVYYFLGNGWIQAAIQVNRSGQGTALGLLLMHPEKFGKKREALNFHPERGIEDSQICLGFDDHEYRPDPASLKARWQRDGHVPVVAAQWQAGDMLVREEFYCPSPREPRLWRVVTVQNRGKQPHFTKLWLALAQRRNDQAVDVKELGPYVQMMRPDARTVTVFEYALVEGVSGNGVVDLAMIKKPRPSSEIQDYWTGCTQLDCSDPKLNHLFAASCAQLPAVISASGKMDGSFWQYNLEWVRDQALVTVGLTMAGRQELAQTILERILRQFVTGQGDTVDSSRVRAPAEVELDQNGALLYALWNLWAWRGEPAIDLIRRHWQKIVAVAEFPLQNVFWDKDSRLLKNTREFWERHAAYGVAEGYELAYQFFVAMGLEKAAIMAARLGQTQQAARWREAAATIKTAMLTHSRFAMIEDGHFIKRRLASGEVQRTLAVPDRSILFPSVPLTTEPVCYLDPDASEALPIALEFVDPQGELARKTLAHLETLWNQRWSIGGYGRYHVTSEPDSPGPWPFATLFIARAHHEAGNYEKVTRALHWLLQVPGGEAGSWFEFYGPRPVPPCPQVGIIPWTWAELIVFFVHHLLGVRPGLDGLLIRPRLLPELKSVKAHVRIRDRWIDLEIYRAQKTEERRAVINGQTAVLEEGRLLLPSPENELRIEMRI
jgi:hypothetical protein